MAQLYPDEHAQALAELRSCSWHVPEHTIAQLIGFDGDVQNLRAWSGSGIQAPLCSPKM